MSAGAYLPGFLRSQLFVTPPRPTQDCTGKTIIVTGANTGLGKEAARHFLRLNASKVILACRSIEKGEAAKKDLESSAGLHNKNAVIEVWHLDMASYASVKKFAERVKTLERLDIALENAGIATSKFSLVEGDESTITVNVVSTFLLALLVLPKLQESSRKYGIIPNLCIVGSGLQWVTPFPERKAASIFDKLNEENTARMNDRYNVSKLLVVLGVRELSKRYPMAEGKVTINTVCPGFCHSELLREQTNPAVAIGKKVFARTTEEGSRVLVYAALAGPETHGKYIHDCKVKPCAPLVEGKEGPDTQRRVWEELSARLEGIQPGATEGLKME